MTTPSIPFNVLSVQPASEAWKRALRARARVEIADAVVVELELIEGKKGPFVAYPSRREKRHAEDAWTPIVSIEDRDLERAVFDAVRKEYAALEDRRQAEETRPDETDRADESPSDLPF